jgi:hypothetical protein
MCDEHIEHLDGLKSFKLLKLHHLTKLVAHMLPAKVVILMVERLPAQKRT